MGYEENAEYRSLWLAVLNTAFLDLKRGKKELNLTKVKAITWVFSEEFDQCCTLAGVETAYCRKMFLKKLHEQQKKYDEDDKAFLKKILLDKLKEI